MSKLTALQQYFNTEEIEQDYDTFTVDGTEYLVLTIDEVNDRAYEYVKENIEETLRYEVPEYLRRYFDKEEFISDNLGDPFDDVFYNGSYKTIEDEDGNVWMLTSKALTCVDANKETIVKEFVFAGSNIALLKYHPIFSSSINK